MPIDGVAYRTHRPQLTGGGPAAPPRAHIHGAGGSNVRLGCTPPVRETPIKTRRKPFGIVPPAGTPIGTGIINAQQTINTTP